MPLSSQKIVVIGAGIGGLTAALCLRRLGAEVTVLEQSDAIREVGAGLQISPNGVAVLKTLGLSAQLADRSVRAGAVVLADHRRGDAVLRLDLAKFAADQAYFFVHRADLIDLLADAARASGVQIRLLQKVEAVHPGSPPRIDLANGVSMVADLVVGADGLHSRARVALNGADTPFFTGQVAWRALVPNEKSMPYEARVFMGPGKHLVSYPLRDGRMINLVAVQERRAWAAEGWNHDDDPQNLQAAFSDFGGEAGVLINRVNAVSLWGLFRHPVAERWHGRGVAVLGDAAHPTLPFLAQGANMALEDAWVLSDSLGGAGITEAGLAAYQNRRRRRAARVIEAANANAWKYHLKPGPFRWVAHRALGLGGTLAPDRMLRRFDWLYRYDVTRDA